MRDAIFDLIKRSIYVYSIWPEYVNAKLAGVPCLFRLISTDITVLFVLVLTKCTINSAYVLLIHCRPSSNQSRYVHIVYIYIRANCNHLIRPINKCVLIAFYWYSLYRAVSNGSLCMARARFTTRLQTIWSQVRSSVSEMIAFRASGNDIWIWTDDYSFDM